MHLFGAALGLGALVAAEVCDLLLVQFVVVPLFAILRARHDEAIGGLGVGDESRVPLRGRGEAGRRKDGAIQ